MGELTDRALQGAGAETSEPIAPLSDRIIEKITLLEEEYPQEFGVCTNLYSLSVNINYKTLLKDFKAIHVKLNKKPKNKTNKIIKQEN